MIMRNILFLFLLLSVGCGKTINVKPFRMTYKPEESHFLAIDTLSKDTIIVKNGDRLISDTVRVDMDFLKYNYKDFYNKLIEEHRALIKDETYVYPEDSSVYEYKSIPYQEVVHIKKDSIIKFHYIAGELYLKEVQGTAVGELSGQSFFTTKNAEVLGWDYRKNITASTKLVFENDWWGTPRHQWRTEISNISNTSWNRHFGIKIELLNRIHEIVGIEQTGVSDFLMIGETMSKTTFISDIADKRIYADYLRLYIDDVYFGEFINHK